MAKEYTKEAKLKFAEGKQELCGFIEKAIISLQQKLDNNEIITIKGYCVYDRAELELQLFEYKEKLRANSVITNDFLNYKDANVETLKSKEKWCELLNNVITEIEKILSGDQDFDNYDKSVMQLYLMVLKGKLVDKKEDAQEFKNNYDVVFLPTYDKRLEECYKNFDEYHAFVKKHVEELKGNVGIYTSIASYDQENPDNKDEDKMLMYYETIKPLVRLLKDKKR